MKWECSSNDNYYKDWSVLKSLILVQGRTTTPMVFKKVTRNSLRGTYSQLTKNGFIIYRYNLEHNIIFHRRKLTLHNSSFVKDLYILSYNLEEGDHGAKAECKQSGC